jgi:phosphohistidine phosphatase
MRHASAGAAPAGGEDIDRPLTPAGRAEAALVGKALAKVGLAPTRALVSDAVRTRQTWEAMASAFPAATAQYDDGLYNADSGRLLALIADETEEDSDETVMILGHNPGIQIAAAGLLDRAAAAPSTIARVQRGFPAATAVAFVVDAAGRLDYDGLFLASDIAGITGA